MNYLDLRQPSTQLMKAFEGTKQAFREQNLEIPKALILPREILLNLKLAGFEPSPINTALPYFYWGTLMGIHIYGEVI